MESSKKPLPTGYKQVQPPVELGSGAFARVILVEKNGKKYAMKVVNIKEHIKKLGEVDTDKYVRREAEIMKKVKGKTKNLVEYIDHGEDDNNFLLIMEYCPGDSLDKYLGKKKILPEAEACDIMTQLAKGYKVLVDCKILHRDLKPANILKGEDGNWKIADFGLSRPDKPDARPFTYNDDMGSGAFKPPPEVDTKDEIAKRTMLWDIWSFGMILLLLLGGEKLLKEQGSLEEMTLKDWEPKLPSDFSAKMKTILKKMLSRKVKNRMSVQEFLETWLGKRDEELELNLKSKQEQCPAGHTLVLTDVTKDARYRSGGRCDLCGRSQSQIEPRWHCAICCYDECVVCHGGCVIF